MKAKDVKIGETYKTKIGSALVKVKVTGEAPRRENYSTGKEGPPRFFVRRVDNGTRLPKPRTAAALRPFDANETPAERAGKRLAKEHRSERIFFGEDAVDEMHLRDIIRMRYPKASDASVELIAKAYRLAAKD